MNRFDSIFFLPLPYIPLSQVTYEKKNIRVCVARKAKPEFWMGCHVCQKKGMPFLSLDILSGRNDVTSDKVKFQIGHQARHFFKNKAI